MSVTGASSSRTETPFFAVLTLGAEQARTGLILGIVGAVVIHAAPAVREMVMLHELAEFAQTVRQNVRARIRLTLDVEVQQPEPEPEPLPEPEPEPEPEVPPELPPPVPVKVPVAPVAVAPPPAAAEAGKVLTADPDPNAPVDLTGEGFVTGTGEAFAGGVTSATGTSKKAVYDTRATGAGPDPTPTVKTAPAAAKVNLSRKAAPAGGSWDDCGFPAEADLEQINQARVSIAVTVDADGTARSVTVLKDPGYGFGALARSCALRKRYRPALDTDGNATTSTTPPISIRFTR
jgi:periplasmic protein TonB